MRTSTSDALGEAISPRVGHFKERASSRRSGSIRGALASMTSAPANGPERR
jgi:hypothetical protein